MTQPEDFRLSAEAHPAMHVAFDYWRSVRPAPHLLPGRQHIDPLQMPRILPYAWLMEVHPPLPGMDIPRFRFRLVGSHVDLGFGGPKTGCWLHEIEPEFNTDRAMQAHFVACARHGTPSHRRGQPRFHFNAEAAELERLMLPLAGDGRHVDMIFGCTIFYESNGDVLRPSF